MYVNDNFLYFILEKTKFLYKAKPFKIGEEESLKEYCRSLSFDENYLKEEE